MAVVKSLADGHIKLIALTAAPADPDAITFTEITAGTDISNKIMFSNYKLGATGSSTIDEKPLSVAGNFQALDASNYEGSLTPFRYYDTTDGQPDTSGDAVFAMMKDKGTTLYLVERESYKLSTEAAAVGDEYSYFEVITDDPKRVDMTGYIKREVPLAVQNAALNKVIVADS